MCGFVGFVTTDKQEDEFISNNLKAMNTSLTGSEPNEEDYYWKENIGFAHKRLSVERKTANDYLL